MSMINEIKIGTKFKRVGLPHPAMTWIKDSKIIYYFHGKVLNQNAVWISTQEDGLRTVYDFDYFREYFTFV